MFSWVARWQRFLQLAAWLLETRLAAGLLEFDLKEAFGLAGNACVCDC